MRAIDLKEKYIRTDMLEEVQVIGIVKYCDHDTIINLHWWTILDMDELPEGDGILIALKPKDKDEEDN